MSKLKAIIIDDEKLAREIIKKYLNNYPEINLADECSNGFEGIKKINEEKPDLVFLDIQMPKLTGFEMLELLDDPPIIIFTTAYDQYAIKAFEVNAIDYLLKPFSLERFDEALQKAKFYLENKSKQKIVLEKLAEKNPAKTEFLERVVIKDGNKIEIIPAQNIEWIEAQDDYVMIHSKEGKFLKQKTMKYFESQLDPAEFIRIHRSHIVAISKISKIELLEKESYQIVMKNGQKLPVSKSGYSNLKEVLNK